MIASINGPVQKIGDTYLVIGLGGLGVQVFVPRDVLSDVGGLGRVISLHTRLIVRETELTLYGFPAPDDLKLFNMLIKVSGIGPKLGLAILSTLSPELIRSAIMQEEPIILQRVPGIGKKTAQRILFALRDKLDFDTTAAVSIVSDVDADVIDLLTGLGFSIIESQTALQKVPRDIRDMDERFAYALKSLDNS